MASFNRVILVGNVTRDLDIRYLQGGTAVLDLGLAVNDRRKNQQGEWFDETSFFDVTLWGRTAEVASEYLGKGSSVLIEGRLKQETWEQDGQKRSKVKVIGEKMQMLDRRGSGGGGGGGGGRPPQQQQPQQQRQESYDNGGGGGYDSGPSEPSGGDIPF